VTNCATSFFSNFCSERRFVVSIELPISLSQLRIASKLAFYQLMLSIPGDILRFMNGE
jgi:hypothetical protein